MMRVLKLTFEDVTLSTIQDPPLCLLRHDTQVMRKRERMRYLAPEGLTLSKSLIIVYITVKNWQFRYALNSIE